MSDDPARADTAPTEPLAHDDPLTSYHLRTVRVGLVATVITIASLAAYALLPGHGTLEAAAFWSGLVIAAIAAAVVAFLPWDRMFEGALGQWAMYAWTAGDVALISVAVVANGGGRSQLWVVYALTTLFAAVLYPRGGQTAVLVLTGAAYAAAVAVDGWHITAADLVVRGSIIVIVFVMAMFLARELRAEMGLRAEASLRAHLAEAQARRAEWFRALVQDSADIVTTFDLEGRILYMSAAARSLGYDPDTMVGTNVADLVHPDDLDGTIAAITEQFESGGRPTPIEYRGRDANGSWHFLEGVATNLLDEPTVSAVVVNARDVTERKRAELLIASQAEVLSRIAAGAPLDAVLRLITEVVKEHANALCTIVVNGAPGTQLLVVSSDPRERDEALDDGGDGGWSREILAADGSVLGTVRMRFASTRFATPADQRVAEVAASLAAIALERDAAEARLAHQARHDSLTGLANRQVFVNTLEHALTSARTHETLAVLFVDLDGFKEVNDNMGHYVGDQVLVALGHRLAAALRPYDVIARFGGDEFVALCRVDGADHALYLADCILQRVREPITIGSNRITLDASVGVTLGSVFADDGPRWVVNGAWVQAAADELLRQADTAMYRAKEAGGGRAELFATTRRRNLICALPATTPTERGTQPGRGRVRAQTCSVSFSICSSSVLSPGS